MQAKAKSSKKTMKLVIIVAIVAIVMVVGGKLLGFAPGTTIHISKPPVSKPVKS